ncbi:hypothetical protein ID866_7539 [Astraeus odoratus]|nr:hypothetical protein ID866_7539 [Astraeus odoratus]
MNLMSEQTTL